MVDVPITPAPRRRPKPREVCRLERQLDPWTRRITVAALALGLLFCLVGIFALAWERLEIPPALTGLAGVLAGALTTTSLPSIPARPGQPPPAATDQVAR